MTTPTLQSIFTRVSEHLLAQNAKAVASDGVSCAYRGEDGLKCAVGCLITDEFYKDSLEGVSISNSDAVLYAVIDSLGFSRKEIGLKGAAALRRVLYGLQQIHDGSEPDKWPARLAELATTFGFNLPEGATA